MSAGAQKFSAREKALLDWIGVEQSKLLSEHDAAAGALSAETHAAHSARFWALSEVWAKLQESAAVDVPAPVSDVPATVSDVPAPVSDVLAQVLRVFVPPRFAVDVRADFRDGLGGLSPGWGGAGLDACRWLPSGGARVAGFDGGLVVGVVERPES